MPAHKNPNPNTQASFFSTKVRAIIKLGMLGLLMVAAPLTLYVRVDSKDSGAETIVRTAGAGGRYLNLQDGRRASVTYNGVANVTEALASGEARPRSLSAIDLDGDAAPDLVAGYAFGGTGIVTIQRGNPEGFAPKDDSVLVRMQQGYNPDSLLPQVSSYQVPEPADFLQTGDFNDDGRKDVLMAANGGGLYLLGGDGNGGLAVAQPIALDGTVTALTAGQFRAADRFIDVAVSVIGPSGSEVLIFDGAAGGLNSQPLRVSLSGPATAAEFGELDQDPFMDLAVAAGSEITAVHGWGRKTNENPASKVERIGLSFVAQSIALENFIWDRQGAREIAAMSADGAVHLLERADINTVRFSAQELTTRASLKGKLTRKNEDVELVRGWSAAEAARWSESPVLGLTGSNSPGVPTQALLFHGKISTGETNPLVVIDGARQRLQIARQVSAGEVSLLSGSDSLNGDISVTSLDLASAPTAFVQLPRKLNGYRDLVLLQSDGSAAVLIPSAPNAIFNVNTTSDHAPDGNCNAAPDCTLREAVIAANTSAGPDTINLPAGTYTLTIIGNTNNAGAGEGFSGNPAIGDLDFRDTTEDVPNTQTPGSGDATTVTGAGSGTTFIVQSTANDRVIEPNPNGDLDFDWTISGVTIAGGRDTGGSSTGGGGGVFPGSKGNLATVTNCVIANNRATGAGGAGGGGITFQGGSMVITNTVFGGATTVAACPSQTNTTCGNSTVASGGGLAYSPGDPFGRTPSAGTLTVQTTSSFQNNAASALTAGGAGADFYTHNLGTGSVSVSNTSFTSNAATGTASGGGIIVESIATTISATTFTNNSAGNRGGGIQVAGGSLTLNGTSPSITFTGNTATTAGSSISTSSAVNLQGTNTTIGGDLEITTNGIWINEVGSAMSPTNLIIIGTGSFTANNSTTNVAGNFQFQSGTFNAGTGLFNFNGTGAQIINNSVAITFNNLTDSNTANTLTINNNIAVNGTLQVNSNATLAPLAGTIISGSGTMTGNGTVRVTRTAATADFSSQYTITNKTLTNLLVDYVGSAVQVLSSITYGPLRINNGNGVNSAAGTATVNGQLTLQAGALNVGTSTLVINNGTTVNAGSITSAATGTVNYNQSSAGQDVRAFNYGNLTFSAFTKVLASTGTIGVAGTFNPNGLTTGHTITGSTINFNGAGAQTVPVFNYNNLTISGARGGATVTLASGTIGIAGTFSPTATAVVYSLTGNTIDFNGTGVQGVAAFNYNNLTISGNRGGAGITLASGNVGIAGIFNPSATNNTWSTGGNTVVFNGTAAQTIPAFVFFNSVTINNAAGVSLGGNVTVGGALTLTNGALAVGTNTLTLNGAVSATAGTLTSSPTGTVIYNQGTNGQATVLAMNYGNLTFSNFNKTLASTGTIGISGTFTPGTATGHTITGSTINFNGAGAQTITGFTYNNLTSSGGVAARTLDPVNTIKIAGVFTPGTNVYTLTGSTVEYNGGSPQTMPATFTTYNNLTLNNLAGVTGFAGLTVQGLLRVQAGTFTSSSQYNNVQIDAGATLAATAASTINVSGNWTNNGTFTSNTGTVVFNGNNNTQTLTGTTTFNNLTINHTGTGNVTATGTTNVNAIGTSLLRVQGGTFIIGPGTVVNVQIDSGQTLQGTAATTLNVTGNWTNNGGTFTPSGNTVNFTGGAAQSIGGTSATQTFDNFTVAKTAGTTLNVVASTTALDINGNVTLTTGIFAAGTAATISVAGNWTNNATFTPGAGTVVFDGNNNTQTLAGTTSFNNLTSNHTGTGNVNAAGSTLTVTGLLRVQAGTFISASTFNNVQIDSGATLEGTNATTMNVSGNWTNNGGTFTPNGNTVNFNGTGAQVIGGTAASQTFNNFVVNKSAGALTVGGSTTSVTTNNLTMTLGSFTAPAALDINGNTLLTAGTLTAGTNITAAGNWTNNGATFAGGAGTVTFDGGVGQTIGGTTATIFNNLTTGNANGIAMANDNTVNGILALANGDITVAATRTLTQPASGTSAGTFDVNGRVLRTGFVTGGAALSFGNPLNFIQVTAGAAPANILVDLTRSVPTGVNGFPNAVQRTYTITPSAAGFTGTLRLRYLESELNGNVEGPNFIFRRFESGFGWRPVVPTSSDFTANWLEATGVTAFSPWTFSSVFSPTASNGVITGRIVDNNGAPVEGAIVRLEGTQSRKFITDANGVYRFENVETNGFYMVTPSRPNYTFSPANRSFTQVGESTNAAFGATVASSGLVNPLDTPEYFVRQHYLDFLGREPDEAGFNFWSDQILECGSEQNCIARRRENVSAAYFLSIEFRKTGGIVDSLYQVAFSNHPDFAHFMPDMRAVGQGVIVNKEGWEAKLQANKEAFIADFVNRPAFHAVYDGMTNSAYVETLISHTGVSFTAAERDTLVSGLNQGTMTRGEALVAIAENERFVSAKLNEVFVMMEYYGYLRRDPDASGFAFWLNKLNQFGGNFEQAEMVKSFIVSGEYRDRFPK